MASGKSTSESSNVQFISHRDEPLIRLEDSTECIYVEEGANLNTQIIDGVEYLFVDENQHVVDPNVVQQNDLQYTEYVDQEGVVSVSEQPVSELLYNEQFIEQSGCNITEETESMSYDQYIDGSSSHVAEQDQVQYVEYIEEQDQNNQNNSSSIYEYVQNENVNTVKDEFDPAMQYINTEPKMCKMQPKQASTKETPQSLTHSKPSVQTVSSSKPLTYSYSDHVASSNDAALQYINEFNDVTAGGTDKQYLISENASTDVAYLEQELSDSQYMLPDDSTNVQYLITDDATGTTYIDTNQTEVIYEDNGQTEVIYEDINQADFVTDQNGVIYEDANQTAVMYDSSNQNEVIYEENMELDSGQYDQLEYVTTAASETETTYQLNNGEGVLTGEYGILEPSTLKTESSHGDGFLNYTPKTIQDSDTEVQPIYLQHKGVTYKIKGNEIN